MYQIYNMSDGRRGIVDSKYRQLFGNGYIYKALDTENVQ